MSSCLSGGVAYSFEVEMKSPPSRDTSHDTRSPSSTLTDSSSLQLAISTRKARTPRKRPNQMYDEAVALLSTANPNIFSSIHKTPFNPHFLRKRKSPLTDYHEPSQLFLPFKSIEESNFLFQPSIQTKSDHCEGSEIEELEVNRFEIFDEFDAESILDEEIEQGIDSIMGKIESSEENRESGELGEMMMMMNSRYGSSIDLGFDGNFELGIGLRRSLRDNDDWNWWRFSTVEFEEISPRIQTTTSTSTTTTATVADCSKKKKKKKKVATATVAAAAEPKSSESGKEDRKAEQRAGPLLKLDYDGVLEAWSGKDLPFSGDIMGFDLDLDLDTAGVK